MSNYNPADAYDAHIDRLERDWRRSTVGARCLHCAYAVVHPVKDMEPLIEYVLGTIRSNYELNDSTYKTEERIAAELSNAIEEFRLRLAFCTCPEFMEPLDATTPWSETECDCYEDDAHNRREYKEWLC